MGMIAADQRTYRVTGQVGWLGLWIGGHPALSLHSSNQPGELSQWPRHDDSTINTVISTSIITSLNSNHSNAKYYLTTLSIQQDEPTVTTSIGSEQPTHWHPVSDVTVR